MTFRRFFLVRLAWALFGFVLASLLVFLIFRVASAPPPPAGEGYERFREITAPYYFDPIHLRFADFVGDLGRGSFGQSFGTREESRRLGLESLGETMQLVSLALLLWLAVAVLVGGFAARSGRPRTLGRALVYLAIGTSPICIGLFAAVELGERANAVREHVLPAATLSVFFAAIYARVIVRCLREEAAQRSRLALVITRMAGRDFGYAIGAAALVEVVFGVPGLGRTLVRSLNGFDLPVAETALLLALWLAITVHFLVDLLVGALDKDLRREWPVAAVRVPT